MHKNESRRLRVSCLLALQRYVDTLMFAFFLPSLLFYSLSDGYWRQFCVCLADHKRVHFKQLGKIITSKMEHRIVYCACIAWAVSCKALLIDVSGVGV